MKLIDLLNEIVSSDKNIEIVACDGDREEVYEVLGSPLSLNAMLKRNVLDGYVESIRLTGIYMTVDVSVIWDE